MKKKTIIKKQDVKKNIKKTEFKKTYYKSSNEFKQEYKFNFNVGELVIFNFGKDKKLIGLIIKIYEKDALIYSCDMKYNNYLNINLKKIKKV